MWPHYMSLTCFRSLAQGRLLQSTNFDDAPADNESFQQQGRHIDRYIIQYATFIVHQNFMKIYAIIYAQFLTNSVG